MARTHLNLKCQVKISVNFNTVSLKVKSMVIVIRKLKISNPNVFKIEILTIYFCLFIYMGPYGSENSQTSKITTAIL